MWKRLCSPRSMIVRSCWPFWLSSLQPQVNKLVSKDFRQKSNENVSCSSCSFHRRHTQEVPVLSVERSAFVPQRFIHRNQGYCGRWPFPVWNCLEVFFFFKFLSKSNPTLKTRLELYQKVFFPFLFAKKNLLSSAKLQTLAHFPAMVSHARSPGASLRRFRRFRALHAALRGGGDDLRGLWTLWWAGNAGGSLGDFFQCLSWWSFWRSRMKVSFFWNEQSYQFL